MGVAPSVFEANGAHLRVVDAWADDGEWPAPSDVAGLVVFGGVMNADQVDLYPFLARERELMREALTAGTPVLGVCLGAQLLARALDRPVYRSPVREFGFVPLAPTESARHDPLLSAIQPGDRIFQWHEDTFDLPSEAELLVTGEQVVTQAFRAGPDAPAWGIQFHAEVTAEELESWFDEAGPKVEAEWGRTYDEVRAEMRQHLPTQHERAGELFGRFARVALERA
jgi:GMP synthase-like glutamine amidotransferase